MARKDVLDTDILVNQSLSASFISPVTIVKWLDNCSYQIDITTTNSTGTFAIEASDNYSLKEPTISVQNPGTWVPLNIGGTPVAAGANDTILIDMNQLPFKALRVRYTSSVAGTGTCTIRMISKQAGG